MTNAKKPHVHAEVIKAWADGAEIEYCTGFGSSEWRELINGTPAWSEHLQYRVKPEPVVKYHGILQGVDYFQDFNHTTGFHASLEAVRIHSTESEKWKVIAIVKTTFVDRVPVAMEIVK